MSKIFGGSKQSSHSYNRAYDSLNSSFSPMFGLAQTGADSLQKLLGGDSSGFDAYKNATGFGALLKEGSRGITGNAAARGVLNSGGTGKALVRYGNAMQNQYAGDYMQKLLGLGDMGFKAGSLVSGAGVDSTSQGKSKPGIGQFLGQIAGGIAASDRRLKTNVFEVGKLPNGLTLYQFRYLDGSGPYVGVMADEVEQIKPEALGPTINGYKTVDYDKLQEA